MRASGVLRVEIPVEVPFFDVDSMDVVWHGHYAEVARDQQLKMVEVPGPRGSIFDRNGQALAMSVPVDSVYVNPSRLASLEVAADIIAPVLKLDREQLYNRLKSASDDPKRHGFCWIKRRITPTEAANLRSLRIRASQTIRFLYRPAPQASHVRRRS